MLFFENLKKFITSCPTAELASSFIEKKLLNANFSPLLEANDIKNNKFFFKKNGLIAAFLFPKQLKKGHFLLSHLDSPCFKLKPHPIMIMQDACYLRLEMYGSPLLSSYLGKPLKIAGTYIVPTESGTETIHIDLSQKLTYIPDPAIHLSKESNASLEKSHLFALISSDKTMTLEKLVGEKRNILAHNLYLVSADEPKIFAENIIASPRLDNLSSSFAAIEALLSAKPSDDTLLCAIFFDHEEIGSLSLQGAQSHLLKDLLNDLSLKHYGIPLSLIEKQAYSMDVAHANHISFPDKYDAGHPIYLNHGLVIKHHAQHRYAQDLMLYAHIKKTNLPYQEFSMRNEVGTGSTLGPYFSTVFSCPTQDIGIGLLGMHSTCEMIGEKDLENLVLFAKGILHA